MTFNLPLLILVWAIFGVGLFMHDYKKPVVISGWLDLFLRYGVIMYLICAALYVAHSTIKWRSEGREPEPAKIREPQSTLSLRRADGHG